LRSLIIIENIPFKKRLEVLQERDNRKNNHACVC